VLALTAAFAYAASIICSADAAENVSMVTRDDDVIVPRRAADWSTKLCQPDTVGPASRAIHFLADEASTDSGPNRADVSRYFAMEDALLPSVPVSSVPVHATPS